MKIAIQDKTEEHYRQQDKRAIQALQEGKINIKDVAAAWANKYAQVLFDIFINDIHFISIVEVIM